MAKVGDRIRFLDTLTADANEDHPRLTYAVKGDLGRISKVGGCKEGYWVFWDGWSSADFGAAEGIDFIVVEENAVSTRQPGIY